jgi:hypothetical protein
LRQFRSSSIFEVTRFVMMWEADQISYALDGHMRAATDPMTHAILHRLRTALRSFVECMTIELPKCEVHLKAMANVQR